MKTQLSTSTPPCRLPSASMAVGVAPLSTPSKPVDYYQALTGESHKKTKTDFRFTGERGAPSREFEAVAFAQQTIAKLLRYKESNALVDIIQAIWTVDDQQAKDAANRINMSLSKKYRLFSFWGWR